MSRASVLLMMSGASSMTMVAASLAVFYWLPSRGQTRGTTFFGANTEPGFRDSATGRSILDEFRRRLWTWSLTVVLAALSALAVLEFRPVPPQPQLQCESKACIDAFLAATEEVSLEPQWVRFVPLGVGVISPLCGWVAFALAHRRTRREAVAPAESTVRYASVACEDEPRDLWLDTVDWIVMVVPPLFPIFTAAFLSLHWREIRDDKELTMDISSISYGMVLGLTCTAIQWTLRFRTRSSDWARNASESHRYRAYLGAMMACVFGVLSWRMCRLGLFGLKVPAWPGLASATIPTMRMTIASNALWIVSIWGIRWWLQSHLATESSDPMADRFWKWGYFYSNPDDPALVVPLRSGVGFSHNFARASVWWGLAIFTTSVTASLAVSLGLMR